MVLIEDSCSVDLDQLAMDHFLELINPRNQDGTFHKTRSLIGRIEQQLKNDIFLINRVRFWNYLQHNNFKNLQIIITGRPTVLAHIIDDIGYEFGHSFFSKNLDYNSASNTEFGKVVKRVFGYENYRDNGLAAVFTTKLNVDYCPYCNLQKTQSVQITNSLTERPKLMALYQLDHFYPQSRYPFLGVSFFNLIPGCSPCNAHLKGEKNFTIQTHFNPFHKSFNEFFVFRLSKIIFNDPNEVEIEIAPKKAHGSSQITDFGLTERYNDSSSKKTVFDLITSHKNRSPVIKRSISSQIRGLFGAMDNSNATLLKSQGVPLEIKEINDYQMGKLKRDVCLQLELL